VASYAVMRHDPANHGWAERDLFRLSKGHASLGLYAVLAHLGYVDAADVASFGVYQTAFGCHPDRFKVPGVEASTGSLGHGISLATGIALGLKIKKSSRRVITLIGDGEANEGSVWEAIMVAVDQKLDNLTILYDGNQSQGRCLQIPNPLDRFQAFGCDAVAVPGHDLDALAASLAPRPGGVNVSVMSTQKGYGCQTLVDNMYEWHRRSPDAAMLAQLKEELHAWAF